MGELSTYMASRRVRMIKVRCRLRKIRRGILAGSRKEKHHFDDDTWKNSATTGAHRSHRGRENNGYVTAAPNESARN